MLTTRLLPVDSAHIAYPALATPQSVQRNDAQTTRSVQREGSDLLTGSPTKASRAPPSLCPRSESFNKSPLSPPLQPHLFYSTNSPGVAMPPPSNDAPPISYSIHGLASYLYPSEQDQHDDTLTSIPKRPSRRLSGLPASARTSAPMPASDTPTQRKRDARTKDAFRQVEDIVQNGSPTREDGRYSMHHEADETADDDSLHDLLDHISADNKRRSGSRNVFLA